MKTGLKKRLRLERKMGDEIFGAFQSWFRVNVCDYYLETARNIYSASTGPASSLADPDHAAAIRKSKQSAKRSSHRPKFLVAVAAEAPSKRCFPVERPLAGVVKKIIAVAPAALGFHPGSSVFRRQPARLPPSPIRITPRRSQLQQSAKRSSNRTRILPLRRHQL